MDKVNSHIINEYIFVSNKDNYTEEEENYIAHNFGYIDGYFNESVYGNLIKYGSSIVPYQIGYKIGEKQRNETNDKNVEKEKDMWLKRLAAFDGIQNVEELSNAIKEIKDFIPQKYKKNTGQIINIIEEFIDKN